MHANHRNRPAAVTVALLLAAMLTWPAATFAQLGGQLPLPPLPLPSPTPTSSSGTVTGQATVVQATLLGLLGTPLTTTLADTGTLAGSTDARDASQLAGSVPSLLNAEVLQADTIGLPGEVDSEASLANLNLTVAGIPVSADYVGCDAIASTVSAGYASCEIDNLTVASVPVAITGDPNQTVAIPGGQLVINEQSTSSTGCTTANALHFTVYGVADVVVASATAGVS